MLEAEMEVGDIECWLLPIYDGTGTCIHIYNHIGPTLKFAETVAL